MATYRDFGFDSFLIRSIKSSPLERPPVEITEGGEGYTEMGFDYNLNHRELDLPKFSPMETKNLFQPDSISHSSVSSDMALNQYWKLIDDEASNPAATDTGWQSPDSNVNPTSYWANPGNAYASDNNYTTVTPPKYNTRSLGLRGFDFSGIPAGAAIEGLELNCECYRQDRLYLPGSSVFTWGFNLLGSPPNTTDCRYLNNAWATSETTITVGGNGDLWDYPLTRAYLQDASFTMWTKVYSSFSTILYTVDHLQLKVYYST